MPSLSDLLAKGKQKLSDLLPDAQFYGDVGTRLGDLLSAGVQDVFPTGAGPGVSQALGVPADPAYGEKLRNLALAGLTVYHGSPYKFDAFDMSKIGTGEGAQAYGHGLYVAESPQVATSYAQSLAGRKGPNLDNAPVQHTRSGFAESAMANMLQNRLAAKLSPEAAKAQTLDWASKHPQIGQETAASVIDRLSPPVPHLYRADIPDEAVARMLDWDKPLSQQHADVQKAVQAATNEAMNRSTLSGKAIYESLPKDMTGGEWHQALARLTGTKFEQTGVADQLRTMGIPGIKYADAMSRGAEGGTSNYVLFSDQLPRILERNSVPTGAQPWAPGEWQ